MALSRNQTHYITMTIIYNALVDFTFAKDDMRGIKDMMENIVEEDFDSIDPFIKDTVFLSLQKYGEIVTAYKPYLKNWKWERLPLLTESILLMSYVHFYYIEKVDKKIVINIAVDLAKKYIDDKQAKFINAILDGGVLDGERK